MLVFRKDYFNDTILLVGLVMEKRTCRRHNQQSNNNSHSDHSYCRQDANML